MILFVVIAGGLVGLGCRYYLSHFRDWVAQEVYFSYQALFDHHLPDFNAEKCTLPRLHCAPHWVFFIGFSGLFIGIDWLFDHTNQGLFVACYLSIASCIAYIDWRYQLIPLQLCYGLFLIGLSAAYFEVSPVDLAQSLQSALVGCLVFYCLYYLSKRVYGKEALGMGDCWLMLGLGSLSHSVWLPLWLFIACLSGLMYVLYLRIKGIHCQQLPFAPFLILGACCVILPNWSSPRMMAWFWQ
ncbi:prepilin peptidase [Bisgaard Taxon 45]|uniref:A24 family peptidase n=1 Tax=Bisgaard Taxon 45 TaxID=304289 RepID=A0ABT9KF20_9PAST|nr:A24 family peptidase [Bisgaard Taxon 45]